MDEGKGGGFTQIVGVGFKGKAPEGESFSLKLGAEVGVDFFKEEVLLFAIYA